MIDVSYGISPIERRLKVLLDLPIVETRTRPEQSFVARQELIKKLTLENAKVHGATVSGKAQIAVLLAIAQTYPRTTRTVSDLAEVAGSMGKSTTDRALLALQQAGLVRRARFLERRVLVICWSKVHELLHCA